jgi:hypothetical protein
MLTSASALVMNRFLSKSARLTPQGFHPITKAFETVALIVTYMAFGSRCGADRIRERTRKFPTAPGIGTTHHLSGESIRLYRHRLGPTAPRAGR